MFYCNFTVHLMEKISVVLSSYSEGELLDCEATEKKALLIGTKQKVKASSGLVG